jgi:hypothetical protein
MLLHLQNKYYADSITVFFLTFSIVRYSREQKTRRFGNWICFRPQVKEGLVIEISSF